MSTAPQTADVQHQYGMMMELAQARLKEATQNTKHGISVSFVTTLASSIEATTTLLAVTSEVLIMSTLHWLMLRDKQLLRDAT